MGRRCHGLCASVFESSTWALRLFIMTNDHFENVINNIKNIPEILKKSKDIISSIIIYAESGAGLVKVKLNGKKEIIKIHVHHSLMKEDKLIVEDLVKEAINNANKKIDIEVNNKMISIMKEMGVPHHFISMLPFFNSK